MTGPTSGRSCDSGQSPRVCRVYIYIYNYIYIYTYIYIIGFLLLFFTMTPRQPNRRDMEKLRLLQTDPSGRSPAQWSGKESRSINLNKWSTHTFCIAGKHWKSVRKIPTEIVEPGPDLAFELEKKLETARVSIVATSVTS